MFYQNEKIATDIPGLDQLLYGGIQLQDNVFEKTKPLSIVILGDKGRCKSLLAMQLLHGLTKSLLNLQKNYNAQDPQEKEDINLGHPVFISNSKRKENLSDMLLDTVISKCTRQIMINNIQNTTKWDVCKFSYVLFAIKEEDLIQKPYIPRLDKYIGEEVIVYNNRTNALHFVTGTQSTISNELSEKKISTSNNSNLIAQRRYNDINDYLNNDKIKLHDIPEKLRINFFQIDIIASDNKQSFNVVLDKNLSNLNNASYFPCVVIDGTSKEDKHCSLLHNDKLKPIYKKSLLNIYVINNKDDIETINPDLVIELRTYEDPEIHYIFNQISITKSALQDTAIGWHQYKKRDYGIEIYPSTHLLLQRRRHMPKALLRANEDILSDTFQQHIDIKNAQSNIDEIYTDFIEQKANLASARLNTVYNTLQDDLHTSSILKNILIGHDNIGQTTVIIGESNSYKRFLALAKTFSLSTQEKHSLFALLDQDNDNMLKSIICPTWECLHYSSSLHDHHCVADNILESHLMPCRKCYSHIHFWNLRMGNITPDEFFYYLIQQLETIDQIKLIVIENIMKLEYSFPLLKRDKMFLTTLISICKDHNVDLVILCDKTSEYTRELRTLADNVIYSEREEQETRIYLERYYGYNAPSHIFACCIKKIEELFYCQTSKKERELKLNENRVETARTHSLDSFWMDKNTKNKIKALAKK
jgi:hypothetical protein